MPGCGDSDSSKFSPKPAKNQISPVIWRKIFVMGFRGSPVRIRPSRFRKALSRLMLRHQAGLCVRSKMGCVSVCVSVRAPFWHRFRRSKAPRSLSSSARSSRVPDSERAFGTLIPCQSRVPAVGCLLGGVHAPIVPSSTNRSTSHTTWGEPYASASDRLSRPHGPQHYYSPSVVPMVALRRRLSALRGRRLRAPSRKAGPSSTRRRPGHEPPNDSWSRFRALLLAAFQYCTHVAIENCTLGALT